MTNIIETIERDGYTFRVEHEFDEDAGCPWEREHGHGPVRHVRANDRGYHAKRPGELVLNGEFRRGGHVYVFDDACRNARAEGWGTHSAEPGMSARQIAALAAREDYERMRAWCSGDWHYVGVIVTLLDIEGNATDAQQCLWGIESDAGAYLSDTAQELAGECIHDIGKRIEYSNAGGVYRSGSRSWIVDTETAE